MSDGNQRAANTLPRVSTPFVQYFPPYCAKRDGKWAVWEAWRALDGANIGATTYEWRWMRWWHPADLVLFAKDRMKARREFGPTWRHDIDETCARPFCADCRTARRAGYRVKSQQFYPVRLWHWWRADA